MLNLRVVKHSTSQFSPHAAVDFLSSKDFRGLDLRPLHARLATHLEKVIRNQMKPGDRLPPENELAKQFQVSPVTMREALTSLASSGLIRRQRGSGTFVEDLSSQGHVAILMPRFLNGHRLTPNFVNTYDLLGHELDCRGVANTLYIGRMDSYQSASAPVYRDLEKALAGGHIRAVLNLFRPISTELHEAIQRRGIPFLSTNPLIEKADASVYSDFASGIKEGVRWLAAQGRRKLAFIHYLSPEAEKNGPRYEAFREALIECGLPFEPAWMRNELAPVDRGSGWEEFREIWLARPDRPDALLVGDEGFFPDVATVILEMGLQVPTQLEVMTQSTADSGQLYPFPVSRIEVNPAQTVAALLEALEALLVGQRPRPIQKTLPSLFIPHDLVKAGQPKNEAKL